MYHMQHQERLLHMIHGYLPYKHEPRIRLILFMQRSSKKVVSLIEWTEFLTKFLKGRPTDAPEFSTIGGGGKRSRGTSSE